MTQKTPVRTNKYSPQARDISKFIAVFGAVSLTWDDKLWDLIVLQ